MNEDDELDGFLSSLDDERLCEVGVHEDGDAGHSTGPVKHFVIYTCPQCGTVGCLSCCRAVAERIARTPVWMLQCDVCSTVGGSYQFKTEVRGI